MRIKEKITDIDYQKTRQFFKNRAGKFSDDNPYSVTMYQDNNKKLVEERNQKETNKLYPLLQLNSESKVLDVACGIGRWADSLPVDIKEYCGVDFSKELIQIANQRNKKENFYFYEGAAHEIESVLYKNDKGNYNRILLVGILMYLNDRELGDTLEQIERVCDDHAVICVREPVGLKERLTLKDFFSDELKDDYNAIYRTCHEFQEFFDKSFLKKGFELRHQGFLFDEDALNNRKETAQYFYILER